MKQLYILEGPDGGGKTVLGKELAARLSVSVGNHGPYSGEKDIWLHYFNSMLPAYSGERDVILDRCWIAEPIYGEVYRNGVNRLEPWQIRLLEYIAKWCNAVIIWCLPPIETCVATFNARRGQEMLDNEDQLREVYRLYVRAAERSYNGRFIHRIYDYTDPKSRSFLEEVLS